VKVRQKKKSIHSTSKTDCESLVFQKTHFLSLPADTNQFPFAAYLMANTQSFNVTVEILYEGSPSLSPLTSIVELSNLPIIIHQINRKKIMKNGKKIKDEEEEKVGEVHTHKQTCAAHRPPNTYPKNTRATQSSQPPPKPSQPNPRRAQWNPKTP
jgi:hypothetical protein